MTRLVELSLPQDFSLSQSLVSYGHAALAPNSWTPGDSDPDDGGLFSRPLRCHDGEEEYAAVVRVHQQDGTLFVEWTDDPGPDGSVRWTDPEKSFVSQIRRCLRIDEDLSGFHELCPDARRRRWGRTYRSPTCWEDVVRTITNCNMQWPGTCDMNRKLCSALGTPLGSFPTPAEVARYEPDDLAGRCRLGYRAKWIRAIADLVVGGMLDLEGIERRVSGTPDERKDAEKQLRDLPGVGPFAHANILQLFGRTDVLPFDTETCRLWVEEHGASKEKKRRSDVMREAEAYYRARYPGHEWQAYWFDLWRNYEARRGAEGPRWTIPSRPGDESALSARSTKVTSQKAPRKKPRMGRRVSPPASNNGKCGRRRAALTSLSTQVMAPEKFINCSIKVGDKRINSDDGRNVVRLLYNGN